jgi:hypothetical protein
MDRYDETVLRPGLEEVYLFSDPLHGKLWIERRASLSGSLMTYDELVIQNVHAHVSQNAIEGLCSTGQNVLMLGFTVDLRHESRPFNADMGTGGNDSFPKTLPPFKRSRTLFKNMLWMETEFCSVDSHRNRSISHEVLLGRMKDFLCSPSAQSRI